MQARGGASRACSFSSGSCAGSIAASRPPSSGSTKAPSATRSCSSPRRAIPIRPSVEYANPKSSGGLIIDMGIHDFDLARWFMGEVASGAGGRRRARVSRARRGRRHRQRDHQPGVRERPARRRRPHPQRHLRLRHHHGAARHQGHAAHRLPPRDAADGDDQGQRRARHRAVFHGAVRRRLHGAARELRAERAARSPAADHRRRWRRGAEGGVAATRAQRDRAAGRGRVDRRRAAELDA